MRSQLETWPSLRSDYLEIQRQRSDHRSAEGLVAHYMLERRLATRLLDASSTERADVYTEVYSELFESLADHPQHTAMRSGESREIQFQ